MLVVETGARAVRGLAFGPGGRRLGVVTGTRRRARAVEWWDPATGRRTGRLSAFGPGARELGPRPDPVWSADLRFVVRSGRRNRISYGYEDEVLELIDRADRAGGVRRLVGDDDSVVSFTALAMSPDGRWLVSSDAGNEHGDQFRRWDLATIRDLIGPTQAPAEADLMPSDHEPLGSLLRHGQPVFAPDGREFVSGDWSGGVRIDTERWDYLPALVLLRGSSSFAAAHHFAYSSDGITLAGAYRGDVLLWNVATAKARRVVLGSGDLRDFPRMRPAAVLPGGDRGRVTAVAFQPGGPLLAAAHRDGTVQLWDAAAGVPRAAFAWGGGAVWAVAFAPDGMRCACGGAGGRVVVWDVM
jgi:WD40 repeat protein